MNKYIIPVCDLIDGNIDLYKILARNLNECQEKLMNSFSNYEGVENCANYREFLDLMDKEHNIAIGDITDIETL